MKSLREVMDGMDWSGWVTKPHGATQLPRPTADNYLRPTEEEGMSEHELKVWPEFYEYVASGGKPFEVRKDDRGFRAGDTLRLREWSKAGGYTGRECVREVTYVLSGEPWGLLPGYVVLGLSNPAAEARGFARARERAAVLCERETERQRTSRADLDLNTPAGRAAHTYSEERERTADVLSDDIRAMQDESAGDGQG